jgi:hypothetical protein
MGLGLGLGLGLCVGVWVGVWIGVVWVGVEGCIEVCMWTGEAGGW